MKKILKTTLWIVGSLVGLIALFLLSIWIFSGNTPEGGTKIAKKGWAQIGGIKQGYFIRGENECNPVILFLHGGPGSPELPMIKDTELEKHFTVCYYRGYTFMDKIHYPQGAMFSLKHGFREVIEDNLFETSIGGYLI